MTNDYHELPPPDTKRTILKDLLKKSVVRFQTRPANSHLWAILEMLDESCNIAEAEAIVEKFKHARFVKFPTIPEVRVMIRDMRILQNQLKRRGQRNHVEVLDGPRIPTRWLVLFKMIRENKIDSAAFNFSRSRFNLTDDEIWECYESWERKEVHAIIQQEMEGIL
jgi:hypothetical protein